MTLLPRLSLSLRVPSLRSVLPLPDVFLPHMQEAEEIDKVVSIRYPLGEGDSSAPPVSDAASRVATDRPFSSLLWMPSRHRNSWEDCPFL